MEVMFVSSVSASGVLSLLVVFFNVPLSMTQMVSLSVMQMVLLSVMKVVSLSEVLLSVVQIVSLCGVSQFCHYCQRCEWCFCLSLVTVFVTVSVSWQFLKSK